MEKSPSCCRCEMKTLRNEDGAMPTPSTISGARVTKSAVISLVAWLVRKDGKEDGKGVRNLF
jgi:hypothetical protein